MSGTNTCTKLHASQELIDFSWPNELIAIKTVKEVKKLRENSNLTRVNEQQTALHIMRANGMQIYLEIERNLQEILFVLLMTNLKVFFNDGGKDLTLSRIYKV